MRIAYAFLCRKSKRSTGFYFFDSGLILLAVFLLLILILPHTAYSAQISLEWDANTEPNLAGYKIHYGVSSGDYDNTVDIGNYTSCTISELQEGQTYYFAASAYDLNGNQSGYSNEVLTQIHTTDTDGDGLSDDDETHIYGTDPNKADTDNDGMPDGWEVENGLFPLEDDANLDQDGDGFSNREEYVSATDPNDASSKPSTDNSDPDPADDDSTPPEEGHILIPQEQLSIVSVDSEELEVEGEDGSAKNAIDGSPDTIWHTEWWRTDPDYPHEIVIDLGSLYEVTGFRYLPRQDQWPNGTVADYSFFVSEDGLSWNQVATGTFTGDARAEKEVLFPQKTGRFVRFVALSEINGNPWTSAAEVSILRLIP